MERSFEHDIENLDEEEHETVEQIEQKLILAMEDMERAR